MTEILDGSRRRLGRSDVGQGGGTIALQAGCDLGEFEASRARALRVGIVGRGGVTAVQAEEGLFGIPDVGLNHRPEFAPLYTVRAADDFLRHCQAHSLFDFRDSLQCSTSAREAMVRSQGTEFAGFASHLDRRSDDTVERWRL